MHAESYLKLHHLSVDICNTSVLLVALSRVQLSVVLSVSASSNTPGGCP
jgi:hypothetical protein